MTAAIKKQVVTWPVATIILATIATLAGMFGPLLTGGKSEQSKEISKTQVTARYDGNLKRLERNFEDLRSETRQQYKYMREDFKLVLKELREIKRQMLTSSLGVKRHRK